MRLAFDNNLIVSHRFDPELAKLADRHYSRQTIGSPQFLAPGRTLVLRDATGLVCFSWLWQLPEYRDDGEEGYCCAIFRNERGPEVLSSAVILESESAAVAKWGPNRGFTYINPAKLHTAKRRGFEYCPFPVGRCFREAGWRFVKIMPDGKQLFEKQLMGRNETQGS